MAFELKVAPPQHNEKGALLRQLDALRALVDGDEPFAIYHTIDSSGGVPLAVAHLAFEASAYAEYWTAVLDGTVETESREQR